MQLPHSRELWQPCWRKHLECMCPSLGRGSSIPACLPPEAHVRSCCRGLQPLRHFLQLQPVTALAARNGCSPTPACPSSCPLCCREPGLLCRSLQLQPAPFLLQGAPGEPALPASSSPLQRLCAPETCSVLCRRQRLDEPAPQPRQFQADMRRLWSGPPPLPASPCRWTGAAVHPAVPCDWARPLAPRGHCRIQLPRVTCAWCLFCHLCCLVTQAGTGVPLIRDQNMSCCSPCTLLRWPRPHPGCACGVILLPARPPPQGTPQYTLWSLLPQQA